MTKIKIAMADDHELFRKAIIKLIESENDFEVILEAENGLQLLEQLKTKTPDIVVMDIRMPIMDGIEAADRIKNLYPNLRIIAFSQYDNDANIIEMNTHGVKSFIGKTDDSEHLFKAIRIVHSGGVYLTDHAASIIQRYLAQILSRQLTNLPDNLSETEHAVLKYTCKGLSSTDIAEKIYKSHRTIEKYRDILYQKFKVRTKKELIEKTYRLFQND